MSEQSNCGKIGEQEHHRHKPSVLLSLLSNGFKHKSTDLDQTNVMLNFSVLSSRFQMFCGSIDPNESCKNVFHFF